MNQENQVIQGQNNSVAVEQSRAIAEVQAQVVLAKKYPRDQISLHTKIIESCKRPSLASKAFYSYPRGGQTVSGPSIRLAEVLAQNYGNMVFGVKEIERGNGYSVAVSYAWDMENNVLSSKQFEVSHEIKAKGQIKKLTDPRDIYELVANQAARRMRACIMAVIPIDVIEDAVAQCKRTLSGVDKGIPLIDRARKMVTMFSAYGVNQELMEKKIGHGFETINEEEILELTGIYNAIKDGIYKRSDYFDVKDEEVKKKSIEIPDELANSSSKPNVLKDDVVNSLIGKDKNIVDVVADAIPKTEPVSAISAPTPLQSRIEKMVTAFESIGVTKRQIESKAELALTQFRDENIEAMQTIYNSIKSGKTKKEDWFTMRNPLDNKLGEMASKL